MHSKDVTSAPYPATSTAWMSSATTICWMPVHRSVWLRGTRLVSAWRTPPVTRDTTAATPAPLTPRYLLPSMQLAILCPPCTIIHWWVRPRLHKEQPLSPSSSDVNTHLEWKHFHQFRMKLNNKKKNSRGFHWYGSDMVPQKKSLN